MELWLMCSSVSKRNQRNGVTSSGRGSYPACCLPAFTDLQTRPMTPALPRWHLHSEATVSIGIATADTPGARLVPPDGIDAHDVSRMAQAATLARDLINTPSNDMGPAELAQIAQGTRRPVWCDVQLYHR